MNRFKLDRSASKAQTLQEEAADHTAEYKKLSWLERLEIAVYLNSVAYNFDVNNPPSMDRTKFIAKSSTFRG